jgi:hypothetical protein
LVELTRPALSLCPLVMLKVLPQGRAGRHIKSSNPITPRIFQFRTSAEVMTPSFLPSYKL